MNYISEYKDAKIIKSLANALDSIKLERRFNVMEICGAHTHSLMKYGIYKLAKNINFIHGPGCPVCVLPISRLDEAIALASLENVIFCTLADLIRVPASSMSLAQLRANGAEIRALYSPLEALKIAKENPQKRVIYCAIGFETTAPMSACIIEKTINEGIKNLFFCINHVRIREPIISLLDENDSQIDGFLAPSHVSVIIGKNAYLDIAKKYRKAFVISGFEPVDIMHSLINLSLQFANKTHEVYNEYNRLVSDNGNQKAKALIDKYFQKCDFEFRGFDLIKNGGYELKSEYDFLNARRIFSVDVKPAKRESACICAKITKGIAKPNDCKLFAKSCTPASPQGSCMVSSEGACAAYYKYQMA